MSSFIHLNAFLCCGFFAFVLAKCQTNVHTQKCAVHRGGSVNLYDCILLKDDKKNVALLINSPPNIG